MTIRNSRRILRLTNNFPRFTLTMASLGVTAVFAQAQDGTVASLRVTPDSTVTLTVALEISAAVGSSTDSDVQTVSVSGAAKVRFERDAVDGQRADLLVLDLALGNATYAFDFFCLPIFGCQHLEVALQDVQVTLLQPVRAPIETGGLASFLDGDFLVRADYTLGGVGSGSSTTQSVAAGTFAGRLVSAVTEVTLDECALSSQTMLLPRESLPSNIRGVKMTITANLENLAFEGGWKAEAAGPDVNHDGAIDALDLAWVLSTWGSVDGDCDGDCATDGRDLAMVLENWRE